MESRALDLPDFKGPIFVSLKDNEVHGARLVNRLVTESGLNILLLCLLLLSLYRSQKAIFAFLTSVVHVRHAFRSWVELACNFRVRSICFVLLCRCPLPRFNLGLFPGCELTASASSHFELCLYEDVELIVSIKAVLVRVQYFAITGCVAAGGADARIEVCCA